MAKKKILIYTDCFTYSGSENVVENILNSDILNEKYEISFVYAKHKTYNLGLESRKIKNKNIKGLGIFSAINGFGNKIIKRKKDGLKVSIVLKGMFIFSLLLERVGIFPFLNLIIQLFMLKREKPDILFINNGGYPGASSCRFCVLSGKLFGITRIILNVNNMAFAPKYWIDKVIDIYLKKYVSIFITASKAAGEELKSKRNFHDCKFLNIPNTLSSASEIGLVNIIPKLRDEFRIAANDYIIGSVGLLTKRKGYHVLVHAIKLLRDFAPNISFKVFIFGEGEERVQLERIITEWNLNNFIFLPGYRNDVLSYVKDFDLFVLPSISNEDFPYVILEAMALSKVIVGTNIAGIPEQIDNLSTGLVVPSNSAQEISNAIFQLMTKSDILKMGHAARERYFELFNNRKVMREYLRVFENV